MKTNVQSAYNDWANSYDDMENKTRDLDRIAIQSALADILKIPAPVLEFGCGTGKNTEWLFKKSKHLTAVDFSEGMLQKAKQKISAPNLIYQQADITKPWPFEKNSFMLVTCNLILEHVQDLNFVFYEAAKVLWENGYFFVCELHPYKQYQGGKARFKKNEELISPDCFTHNVSEFFQTGTQNGFTCVAFNEWFDDNDTKSIPRLISFLFQKKL